MTVLLLFSSLTLFLQGSDQRTPDTRSETIPSSRITPDPLDYQLYDASSLQFTHSSSTGFRSENTWHEIRDHSFIQNHSRPLDYQLYDVLLLFSSPHSVSTGFRSENTWHEIRDHSFIQNHSRPFRLPALWLCFFSSVHLTLFLQVQVREHLTRDQRPFLHPESLQTFRLPALWRCFFSSVHSLFTGFRSENTWHEIRDHSFIQNHSRPFRLPAMTLLLFSSPHSVSTGFRSEITWHEIRDHSFIQNHSRSFRLPALWRCFFSSVHLTLFLQGSGQRSPDTRSETIPSSRITPDPLDYQLYDGASSLQFTSLCFYRVQVREHLTRDQRPFLHPESLQTL